MKNRATLADQMANIDRRYASEKRKLVITLLKLHGLSESEFSLQLATVWLWRQGITSTPETLAKEAQSFRDEWSPE